MENQNIKWETWNEQSQESNEQHQEQQGWGEQQHPPQPLNFGNQQNKSNNWNNQEEPPYLNWGEPQNTPPPQPQEDSIPQESSPMLMIKPIIFNLESNLDLAVNDLNPTNLILINGNNNQYDFSPSSNTELGNIIESIVKIGIKNQLKINDCFIYKAQPNETIGNPNLKKSNVSFFFALKSNPKGGNLLLDLSSLGGPLVNTPILNPNKLTLIPGWLPISISKNESNEEIIIIAGSFN